MMIDDPPAEQDFYIRKHHWTLSVSATCPTQFQLLYVGKAVYQGLLELINNGELLELSQAQWKFRHHPERIEQWCQLHHNDNLSLSMNYYFHDQAVVIEYLARNSIPTRLDIRHVITLLTNNTNYSHELVSKEDWKRCRHGLPSESIRHAIKPDLFREAFSATQWIVLDKM